MPATWISTYAGPLATIGAAAVVILGTPVFGAWWYFKQKEYETVRQMYLTDGVVEIAGHVEYRLDVFQANWGNSVHLLRTFRDLGPNTPRRAYESGIIAPDEPVSLEASRLYLLSELVNDNDNVFSNVHQLFAGFMLEADNFFKYDLCSAIRVSVEGGAAGTVVEHPDKVFETYLEALKEKQAQVQSYHVYLGCLRIIVAELVKDNPNFKGIRKFHQRPRISECVDLLKTHFKDELKKFADKSAMLNSGTN